jgi:RNA polymerase sigma factor (sigma-70 family)
MQISPAQKKDEPTDLSTLPDEELIALFKGSGDPSIVGELYNRYAHLLFGIGMKYLKNESDSKDALMHVFEKLFDNLKEYNIGNFKSWIYSVTKNHCLHLLKKTQEIAVEEKDLLWKSPREFVEFGDDLTLSGKLNDDDESKKLMDAIGQLKHEQRICIELFYLQEKSYQEVQAITNFDYNQVKTYIQNGKRNLKIMLTERHE